MIVLYFILLIVVYLVIPYPLIFCDLFYFVSLIVVYLVIHYPLIFCDLFKFYVFFFLLSLVFPTTTLFNGS